MEDIKPIEMLHGWEENQAWEKNQMDKEDQEEYGHVDRGKDWKSQQKWEREPGTSDTQRYKYGRESSFDQYSLNWLFAIPASGVTFIGTFVAAVFFPWLLVFLGCLGLDGMLRRNIVQNIEADATLHSEELKHNTPGFVGKRIATFLLRLVAVYVFGPALLMLSVFGGASYMLYHNHDYRGNGLVLLSVLPGLVFTCFWWGFFWYLLTPAMFVGIAIGEFGFIFAQWLKVSGYLDTIRFRAEELKEATKEKGKEVLEGGREGIKRMGEKGGEVIKETGEEIEQMAHDISREVRDISDVSPPKKPSFDMTEKYKKPSFPVVSETFLSSPEEIDILGKQQHYEEEAPKTRKLE